MRREVPSSSVASSIRRVRSRTPGRASSRRARGVPRSPRPRAHRQPQAESRLDRGAAGEQVHVRAIQRSREAGAFDQTAVGTLEARHERSLPRSAHCCRCHRRGCCTSCPAATPSTRACTCRSAAVRSAAAVEVSQARSFSARRAAGARARWRMAMAPIIGSTASPSMASQIRTRIEARATASCRERGRPVVGRLGSA